ncbi:hypothetical protein H5410_051620 [Solanum commersonii]|uniref:Uncharacterized protein n=1 Tax=Solanum commersonii TaxID=4109 RepID=A0A9J5WYN6_SOLCO|nr:hypothetical protein H5410_051620 [Solanum commersonii]
MTNLNYAIVMRVIAQYALESIPPQLVIPDEIEAFDIGKIGLIVTKVFILQHDHASSTPGLHVTMVMHQCTIMGSWVESMDNIGTLVGRDDPSQLLISYGEFVNAFPSKHIFLDPRLDIFNNISFNFANNRSVQKSNICVCKIYINKFFNECTMNYFVREEIGSYLPYFLLMFNPEHIYGDFG